MQQIKSITRSTKFTHRVDYIVRSDGSILSVNQWRSVYKSFNDICSDHHCAVIVLWLSIKCCKRWSDWSDLWPLNWLLSRHEQLRKMWLLMLFSFKMVVDWQTSSEHVRQLSFSATSLALWTPILVTCILFPMPYYFWIETLLKNVSLPLASTVLAVAVSWSWLLVRRAPPILC